jgi:CubicO group peptidase (beta-lactamase class C family)
MAGKRSNCSWRREALWLLPSFACVTIGACAPEPRTHGGSLGSTTEASIETPSACSDSVAAFRRVVSEFQTRQQNAAVSVGIRHQGVTVFREATGYARFEDALSADPEMAFGIASVTKAFTGVALLKLAEAGRIDLDAEIQRYVPAFPHHPSGRPVQCSGSAETGLSAGG